MLRILILLMVSVTAYAEEDVIRTDATTNSTVTTQSTTCLLYTSPSPRD